MRLLDLIQQHDRVGPAAQFAGELAFLLVADVAGRRANQLRYAMSSMYSDMSRRIMSSPEPKKNRERPRQFGLAHAGWAKEQEYSPAARAAAVARH